MIRIKQIKRTKKNKILKFAKGFKSSSLTKQIFQRYKRSLFFQFISRKLIKRRFRSFWILKTNNFLKTFGCKYSLFIASLKKQKIALNRKIILSLILSDILY